MPHERERERERESDMIYIYTQAHFDLSGLISKGREQSAQLYENC